MNYAELAAPIEAALRATRPKVLAAYRSLPGDTQWKADGSGYFYLGAQGESGVFEVRETDLSGKSGDHDSELTGSDVQTSAPVPVRHAVCAD